MNNNNLSTVTNQQTMTSLEIADLLGKNHFDVLKAIRKMETAWEKITASKFTCRMRINELANGVKRELPYFVLSKTECLFVATKFNDEARAKLVLRWEQLEKERLQGLQPQQNINPGNLPADPSALTRKQLALMILEAEEENDRIRAQNEQLEAENLGLLIKSSEKDQEISRLKERTAYLNVIDSQRDTVTISQIAQDYGQSAVAFNNLLKGLRIQRKIGDQWVLYADFIGKGYVANRMIPIHHSGSPDTYKPMTVWTAIGRRFIYEHLKKHGVLPLIERTQPAQIQ